MPRAMAQSIHLLARPQGVPTADLFAIVEQIRVKVARKFDRGHGSALPISYPAAAAQLPGSPSV
jgi:hypothetical protein